MSEIRRPWGRLFLFAILFLLVVTRIYGAAPATTTVSDVIYRADGLPAEGTLLISWPAFVSADGRAVSAGSMSVAIGEGGSVTLALVPNEGATPSGTYYKVVVKLDRGSTDTEYWTVPTSSPVTIAAIRSTVVPQSVAVQMVSKDYVDSQIAQKANDNAVVHSAGGETISGVKEFAISPRVPAPLAGEDVANKDYVDAAVGLVGEGSYVKKVGDAMTGPLVLSGDPVSSNQAANRHYVDTEVAGLAGTLGTKESTLNKDQASGYAGLDASGYVGNSHLGSGSTDSSKCLKGDHSWGSCGSGDMGTSIRYVTSDYDWMQSPTSPSSLSAGANAVTVSPCPKGVDPTNTSNYYVYIAGTGTPEAALVTGGTACTSNSLTLTFTAVGAHAAGYTIGSASGGIREASNDARIRPSNPTGSWQTGKVIVPPGEYKAYAPIYIQATNQTVDFSGSIIECYDAAHPCIFVGSPTNQNAYQNITLVNPKGRPMVASGTNAFIEVNAQATHITKPLTRAPLSGNTFGYLVQVDDDEAFELEGADPSSGDALRCDSTFCGAAVYAPGPFAGNSAVGWIHHSNFSMNCKGNGIEWQSGNTLKVSDSVIQGYPQFAIRGGKRGGYGGIVFDNVYTEVGSQQSQFAFLQAKDLADAVEGLMRTHDVALWNGNDTSLSSPTTPQYFGVAGQIEAGGNTSTIHVGDSIVDELKAIIAQMVSNSSYEVRPTAIYANPVLLDLIDREMKAAYNVVLSTTEVSSGVRVKTLSTQAGELPLIPEWALGYTGTPGSGTAVLPAYIVSEDLIEYHWLTDINPRVFQLGLSGSLASQMVVVKFGAVVVKGAPYAHCQVIINR